MWRMGKGRPREEANRELKQKLGWLRGVIVEMKLTDSVTESSH